MEKAYEGVKFKTVFTARRAPDAPELDELRHWCRVFHEKGLAPPYDGGSYGNLSFRTRPGANEFIITGSRMGLKEDPGPEAFVRVLDVDAQKLEIRAEGLREPSSETMLHHAVYAARPDVGAVFHGHCQCVLDCAPELGIVQTQKAAPYGTMEMVEGFMAILGHGDFLILNSHGFVGLGPTMAQAGGLCLAELQRCLCHAGRGKGKGRT